MKRNWKIGSAVTAVIAAAFGLIVARSSPVTASVVCKDSELTGNQIRIAVVGESWASGGRINSGLANAVGRRTGKSVRVCSVGYSGENAYKISRRDFAQRATQQLGGDADSVVLLLGVNDQIQHRRASDFAEDVKHIAAGFDSAPVTIVTPPIVIANASLPLWVRCLNWFRGLFNAEVNQDYVDALSQSFGSGIVPYSDFSQGPLVTAELYAADGLHLTREGFRQYGEFIGERIELDHFGAR